MKLMNLTTEEKLKNFVLSVAGKKTLRLQPSWASVKERFDVLKVWKRNETVALALKSERKRKVFLEI